MGTEFQRYLVYVAVMFVLYWISILQWDDHWSWKAIPTVICLLMITFLLDKLTGADRGKRK